LVWSDLTGRAADATDCHRPSHNCTHSFCRSFISTPRITSHRVTSHSHRCTLRSNPIHCFTRRSIPAYPFVRSFADSINRYIIHRHCNRRSTTATAGGPSLTALACLVHRSVSLCLYPSFIVIVHRSSGRPIGRECCARMITCLQTVLSFTFRFECDCASDRSYCLPLSPPYLVGLLRAVLLYWCGAR